jgi:hypothetical protein
MRLIRRIAATAVACALVTALLATPAFAAPPGNDDFDAATPIPTLPFTDTVDTTDATTADDDPGCFGNDHSVWYEFTPSADTTVGATTSGSDYDTTLSAYTGTRGSLIQVACNDDSDGLQSRIAFEASAWTTYWLMAASCCGSPGGQLVLHVSELPPPLTLDLSIRSTGTVNRAGVATIHGNVTCSRPVQVDLVGSLRQNQRRSVSLGYSSTSVSCDGTESWSMLVQGETGGFSPGTARARVTATAEDVFRGPVRRYLERDVTLSRPSPTAGG